ncbi:MAG: aminopeptidase [Actinomycetota bacterium]|jgi:aminopeptidase|nr:aminopeptidase [Actinomycetota bacterium]
MTDNRIATMAEILIDYSLQVKERDLVRIRGNYVAEPLILALYERCLVRGAHPFVNTQLPKAEPIFYRLAEDHQLDFVRESQRWEMENIDADIYIISETNTRQLTHSDPAKQVRAAKARQPLSETFMKRQAAGDLRWTVTLFPTEAHAMEAETSLAEYEDFYYAACLLEADDPVGEWKKEEERLTRLVEWMRPRNEVHIEADGTDLTLEVGGRPFIPASGRYNFPDGEFFTGPKETGTHGVISFTYPAIFEGRAVEDVRLEFDEGRVVDASAGKNEDFLIKTLDTDDGSRVLGELGIGTNYGIDRFSGEILLDEKIGGTVHLALGESYPESGGLNKSAIHWDMVCDLRRGGRITVDGDVLEEDGKLLI